MAELLADPRVTVHVGDGFAFLQSHEGTYDAIITDSSDPVGPAQTLFEAPYFKLMHSALREGGVVCSQGECLWLHLPLIRGMREMAANVFQGGQVDYAFTTIPTYPSGQIGFAIACKDSKRDLRTPLRTVNPVRYYNNEVHKAAFVLPEFGSAMLEKNEDKRPLFGSALALADAGASAKKRKILLLGSGYVAKPCAEIILRDGRNKLTIGAYYVLLLESSLTMSPIHSLSHTCHCRRSGFLAPRFSNCPIHRRLGYVCLGRCDSRP